MPSHVQIARALRAALAIAFALCALAGCASQHGTPRSWQWLWGAILLPLAAAGRSWYTSRKRNQDKPVA